MPRFSNSVPTATVCGGSSDESAITQLFAAAVLVAGACQGSLIVGIDYSGDLYAVDPISGNTTFLRSSGMPSGGLKLSGPGSEPGTFFVIWRNLHTVNVFGDSKPILEACLFCGGMLDTAYDSRTGTIFALEWRPDVYTGESAIWLSTVGFWGPVRTENFPSWRDIQYAYATPIGELSPATPPPESGPPLTPAAANDIRHRVRSGPGSLRQQFVRWLLDSMKELAAQRRLTCPSATGWSRP